jgi:nitrogen fixation protein NifU and related proteins
MGLVGDVCTEGMNMTQHEQNTQQDLKMVRDLLSGSGYAERAIDYYLAKANMGVIPDPDQVTELTGPCGDTMKCYLKMENGRIRDAKYQVLGCPGAISAAMALADLVKGKTLDEALQVKDRDVFRELIEIPDQKQHCIRLAVKTLQKAIHEYRGELTHPEPEKCPNPAQRNVG